MTNDVTPIYEIESKMKFVRLLTIIEWLGNKFMQIANIIGCEIMF